MKSERQIETRLRTEVKKQGGLALKFVSPGCRGVPDRLVFMPGGRLYLVETKAPSKTLEKLQKYMRNIFIKLGFNYYIIDSYKKVEEFLIMIGGDQFHG